MCSAATHPLNGSDGPARVVVVTRPTGTGASLAKSIRARGCTPLILPGMSLRAVADVAQAREGLRIALTADALIFTSPAAVHFASALVPLRTGATVFAVGRSTARALVRHGVMAPSTPARQDSEGLLQHAQLQDVRGCRIAVIGGSGGRGLLQQTLAARGATVNEVHVYQRHPPRLGRRHVQAVLRLPATVKVLLSSVEAVHNLHRLLPQAAWQRLTAGGAVVSSERVAKAAREAGFERVARATSALSADLLHAALGEG